MTTPAGLSKSRIMAGLQCPKLLWWMMHEPTAPELQLDGQTQGALTRGTRVAETARAYVPGGVAIDLPYGAYDQRVALTRRLIEDGAPAIYEASFRARGVYVAVDILKRGDRAFRLIEVKSSTSVKEHHIPDVAIQAYVLGQNGLDLAAAEVMHLNRDCAYPDLSNLFLRSDVTEAVQAKREDVPRWAAELLEMLRLCLKNRSRLRNWGAASKILAQRGTLEHACGIIALNGSPVSESRANSDPAPRSGP